MGARKNNPNKFGASQVGPKFTMDAFVQKERFRSKAVSHSRFYAWEIMRGYTVADFECALVSYDPAVKLWAITHNSIPESGSERFCHANPEAAWGWYKSLREGA
jgi:hypothetical protein